MWEKPRKMCHEIPRRDHLHYTAHRPDFRVGGSPACVNSTDILSTRAARLPTTWGRALRLAVSPEGRACARDRKNPSRI